MICTNCAPNYSQKGHHVLAPSVLQLILSIVAAVLNVVQTHQDAVVKTKGTSENL